MKTKIKITKLLLVAGGSMFVFNITNVQAQWSLTGNASTNPPTNFVGTTDDQPLVFKTASSERVRILTTGEVGVGTTTPYAPLNVAGTNAAPTSSTNNGALFVGSTATNLALTCGVYNNGSGTLYSWLQSRNQTTSSTYYNLVLQQLGGNVGVGTATPQRKFVVSNAAEGIEIAPFSGYTQIISYNRSTSAYIPLVLQESSAGYVGIGTTSPGAKLEVNGQVKITGGSPGANKVLTSDANGLATWSSSVPSGGWSITGNNGTSSTTNFIGTTDNVSLVFRVNNEKSGQIDNTLNNAFFGYKVGYSNTSGYYNSACGSLAFFVNTTGYANCAFGYSSLYGNTTGYGNAALGVNSLQANTTGVRNSALGSDALANNTTSTQSTALGSMALRFSNGEDNTAVGVASSYNTTSGTSNSSLGVYSLYTNTTGTYNTAIGKNSDVSSSSISYSTALGENAIVNSSYKVRIGSATVSVVEGPVSYTVSDGRFKENITEEVKGLEFIKRLRPVIYNFNTEKFQVFLTKDMKDSVRKMHFENKDFSISTSIRQSGFIAQEVEKAAIESGYDFNGVHKPVDENDNYSLAYGEFVVPLVKAVQEQQKMIEILGNKVMKNDSINELLIQQIQKLEDRLNNCCSSNSQGSNINNVSPTNIDVNLSNINSIVLEQNVPNPFAEETLINYFLPESTSRAQILFFEQTGKMIKAVEITEKGNGQLRVFASDLSNGVYTYSLIIDGQNIETRKMIKTK